MYQVRKTSKQVKGSIKLYRTCSSSSSSNNTNKAEEKE